MWMEMERPLLVCLSALCMCVDYCCTMPLYSTPRNIQGCPAAPEEFPFHRFSALCNEKGSRAFNWGWGWSGKRAQLTGPLISYHVLLREGAKFYFF